MDIFDRISAQLAARGISQAELSRMTGISTGLISQWKKRSQQPSMQKLKLVAQALGMSVDELMGADPPAAPGPEVARTGEERKLLLLSRRAQDLPEEEYRKLLQYFEETIDIYLRARGIDPGKPR